MHFDFLQELIAVFMISIVVILICAKFKIPSIVALLVAGIICGPSALKLGEMKGHEKEIAKTEAIINSMTMKERRNPDIINPSRKVRIANGSGTKVQDVNQLLRQFDQMRKMMSGMLKSGKGKMPPMPNMNQLGGMNRLGGMGGLGGLGNMGGLGGLGSLPGMPGSRGTSATKKKRDKDKKKKKKK